MDVLSQRTTEHVVEVNGIPYAEIYKLRSE
jgi:hypothetical protein